MNDRLEARPFSTRAEYEGMIDYFLNAGDELLVGMGVDVPKLPSRERWLAATLADHECPDEEKERFYIAWYDGDQLIGHSSISHIVFGRTAHCHLHLWRTGLRRNGLGTRLLAASIDRYFERFRLETLACEPYAENDAPNRTLPALGFRRVRRFKTIPTSIAFEQDVNRYELTRTDWEASRVERSS